MCGRYTLTDPDEVLEELGVMPPADLPARFNIAPTQKAPVVLIRGSERVAELHRWGLIPSWAESPAIGAKMINARAESAAGRAAFRDSMRARRCLVAADGFFEWHREGKRSVPHLIRRAGGGALAFAGLWERWKSDGDWLLSFTILTAPANVLIAPIHDRMPVIVDRIDWQRWLAPDVPAEGIEDILATAEASGLEAFPVTERVNSVANDDAECLAPAPVQQSLF